MPASTNHQRSDDSDDDKTRGYPLYFDGSSVCAKGKNTPKDMEMRHANSPKGPENVIFISSS